MTNNIINEIIAKSEYKNVEIIMEDGEPLFELYSLGMALGYVTEAKGKSYPHKTRINKIRKSAEISGVVRGVQLFLTESEMYDFLLESKSDVGRAFRHWVVCDLLPQIRKTGGYVAEGREQEFVNNTPALQSEIRSLHNAIAVLQMQVAPKKCDYAENTWKKRTSTPMAQKVADAYGKNIHDVYNMIYSCMKTNFGFDNVAAMIKYCDKYGLPMDGTVSAITAIADDPMYQMYFAKAVGILLKAAKNTQVASELSNQPKKFTVNDDFEDVITTVAQKLGYDRANKVVYEAVYDKITTKQGWKCLLTRYHCTTKKQIIENQRKYKAMFVNVCNEIIFN